MVKENIKSARLFSNLHDSILVFSSENIELMRELLPEEDWSLITRVATGLILLDEKLTKGEKANDL